MLSLLKMAIIIHTLTINIHLLWRNIIFNWGFSFTGVNHFKSFLKTDWWPTRRRMITDWLLCVCVACVHRCEKVSGWVRGCGVRACICCRACVWVCVRVYIGMYVCVGGWGPVCCVLVGECTCVCVRCVSAALTSITATARSASTGSSTSRPPTLVFGAINAPYCCRCKGEDGC